MRDKQETVRAKPGQSHFKHGLIYKLLPKGIGIFKYKSYLYDMITIYKIVNPKGMIYIGQTKDLKKRLYMYKHNNCKSQYMLYNSLTKYGFNHHIIETLAEVPEEMADSEEIRYIKEYESYFTTGKGMNLTQGGNRPKHTEETKKKLSEAILGPKNIRAKKLYQYTLDKVLIREWECMNCIQRELGFFTSALSQAAKGNGRMYGYLWSYNPL